MVKKIISVLVLIIIILLIFFLISPIFVPKWIKGEDNYKKQLTDYYVSCLNSIDETKVYTESDVQDSVNAVLNNVKSAYGREDKSTEFQFYVDDDIKVLAKDLKTYNNTTLQYVAFMPTNIELTEFIDKTTTSKLLDYIHNLRGLKKENFKTGYITKITGSTPKFSYEYKLDLINDLKKMGVNEVFTRGKADLTNIVDDKDVYIEKALHAANIDFNEYGIKAAAVTLGGGAGNALGGCNYVEKDLPIEEINLVFDKPYLYIIRDKDTGEVWFTGTVYSPNLAN